jgi:hypothetical protein
LNVKHVFKVRIQGCFFFLVFSFSTLGVNAEELVSLYQVQYEVASQSANELTRASREALKTIFVRVSGTTKVMESPKIKAAVSNPRQFMKQFQYERLGSDADGGDKLFALMEFESELVDGTLREAGLSLWSNNRPTILLWLTVEDTNGRRFATKDSDPDIVEAIISTARRRGLAVKLPLYDLQDTLAVTLDEAWSLSNWRAQAAAARYEADTVLLGRVSRLSNGELFGKWIYTLDPQRLDFDIQSDNPADYLTASLHPVAELLAAQYAVAPINIAENGVLLRLTGILNYIDYARAVNYLEGVSAIRHANVVNIEGNEIIIRLIADGLVSQLQNAFSLDRKLLEATNSSYRGSYDISLDYHWPGSEQN